MIYFLFILLIICSALEVIGYKNTKKNSLVTLYGEIFWFVICNLIVFTVFAICKGVTLFNNLTALNILFIFILSILALTNILMWANTTKNLPMSIADGISNIYVAFVTLFSWLIFGGEITIWQIILIAIIIITCIILAILQNSKNSNLNYNYKLGFTFLFTWIVIAIGRELMLSAAVLGGVHPVIYTFFSHLLIFLISMVILKIKKYSLINTTREIVKDKWLILTGVSSTVLNLSLLFLVREINIGIVDAVAILSLVLITLYERFIMKEKIKAWCYPLLLIIALSTALLMLL